VKLIDRMYMQLPKHKGTGDFLKHASLVARASGFRRIDESPQPKNSDDRRIQPVSFDAKSKKIDSLGGELACILKGCADKGMLPSKEPTLIYHAPPAAGKLLFGLHVIGSKQSIAEALVLKTAFGIIEESGISGASLAINSIGDRDSSAKFVREATNYLRRHSDRLPVAAAEMLRDDPYGALDFIAKKQHPILEELPRPMEFLTSASRRHLREVLEYVERNEIPYEIDERLIGHRECYSQTVFEVRTQSPDGARIVLAKGGRYDEFPRRLFKVASPGVGIVFALPHTGAEKRSTSSVPTPKNTKPPKICFIYVGFEAKVKSLMVIDAFRRARVPFHQCLQYEKLSDQMRYAESLSVPYTVIMGQKEALESCVIVRNVATRAQESVPIGMLPRFFKARAL
jgi:histidyl-tRNA synthetase